MSLAQRRAGTATTPSSASPTEAATLMPENRLVQALLRNNPTDPTVQAIAQALPQLAAPQSLAPTSASTLAPTSALPPASAPPRPMTPPPAPTPSMLPPLPAPTPSMLPSLAPGGMPAGGPVSMGGPMPNASGAGAQTGVPPWLTMLQQMPQFGSPQASLLQSLFGGMGPINMANPMAFMSSLRPGMGGQTPTGAGGVGGTAPLNAGGRVGAGQVPALGQGGGADFGSMLQQIMNQLQGGNQTRFQNAFGGAGGGFPFAQFLGGGGGFASPFNPMMAMRAFQPGGLSPMGSFGGGFRDPRATDMRQLLLSSLFGGGGQGGAGGGLDVN